MHIIHDPAAPAAAPITFDDFLKVDIRAGTIVSATPFPEARQPSYVLMIDFGPAIGVRKSAARITERHQAAQLVGRRVLAVVNFPARQIATIRSEVLVLGLPDAAGHIALVDVAADIADGSRLS